MLKLAAPADNSTSMPFNLIGENERPLPAGSGEETSREPHRGKKKRGVWLVLPSNS